MEPVLKVNTVGHILSGFQLLHLHPTGENCGFGSHVLFN